MEMTVLLFVAGLAFANGANDHGKGVATLVGQGAARPGPALAWAAFTTALGALLSCWFAGALFRQFSGEAVLPGAAPEVDFCLAVLGGALAWVLLATRLGLPVSTTHALIGGLLGAGLVTGGADIRWDTLAARIALPLAGSPLLSLLLVYLLAPPLRRRLARWSDRCLCVAQPAALGAVPGQACAALQTAERSAVVVLDREAVCSRGPITLMVTTGALVHALHWLSSGLVGLARGWNDTPKIAALGAAAAAGGGGAGLALALVIGAMAAGGLVAGWRVLATLARRVTPMPLAESIAASTATGALVSLASWCGLPVSTTHVATGALIGIGLRNDPRQVAWRKVKEIVLAWVITLPVAALLAALILAVLR